MPGTIYKYIRKLNPSSHIHTYIPPSFKARSDDLEKCTYQLRHGTPAFNTNIRWGAGDLILEKKSKSNPAERYRSVSVTDLTPVDLNPPPPQSALTHPYSSPAPGWKSRNKRPRTITPTHSSPSSKTSWQEEIEATSNRPNQDLVILESFWSPARINPSSPIIGKADNGGKTAQEKDFQ